MLRGFEAGRKVALMVSELQRGVSGDLSFLPAISNEVARRGVVPKIAALAAAFRAAGQTVIHCHVAHRPDFKDFKANCVILAAGRKTRSMTEGDPMVEPVPGFVPEPEDILLRRRSGITPFADGVLDYTLRSIGVETLVLAGVSSNVAIPGSAIHGVDKGYQVVVPEDCIAGSTQEIHDFAVRETLPLLTTVTTSAAIIDALKTRA